jgi:hypothetical protein
MTLLDDYRAYLMAERVKAQDAAIHYAKSKTGEWDQKKLTNQYLKEVKRLDILLQKERDQPEEFYYDAVWWQKRNMFPLH